LVLIRPARCFQGGQWFWFGLAAYSGGSDGGVVGVSEAVARRMSGCKPDIEKRAAWVRRLWPSFGCGNASGRPRSVHQFPNMPSAPGVPPPTPADGLLPNPGNVSRDS
jgi:hypothetical protein